MDFSELKLKLGAVPGNKLGRRQFPQELQRQVVEAAEASGLGRKQFLSEIGLSAGSFYVMRSAVKAQSKFRRVTITPAEIRRTWEISGPGGIRISCQSVEEVAKLWRALC
jgi:hypothetical protein